MCYTKETLDYKGYTIKIVNDEHPDNPRNWDNLGKMVCWHRRYNLGDKHGFSTPQDFLSAIKGSGGVVLPIFMYDHSGTTIRTAPFSCVWDSGQVGFIYVHKETIKKEYNRKRITKELRSRVEGILSGEVETYDQFLRDDVHGFIIEDAQGEHLDSCYGFYGEIADTISYAKGVINSLEADSMPLFAHAGILKSEAAHV